MLSFNLNVLSCYFFLLFCLRRLCDDHALWHYLSHAHHRLTSHAGYSFHSFSLFRLLLLYFVLNYMIFNLYWNFLFKNLSLLLFGFLFGWSYYHWWLFILLLMNYAKQGIFNLGFLFLNGDSIRLLFYWQFFNLFLLLSLFLYLLFSYLAFRLKWKIKLQFSTTLFAQNNI